MRTMVQVGPSLMFLWSNGPSYDQPGEPSPEVRWAHLRNYTRQHPPKDGDPELYLVITRSGVERRPLEFFGPKEAVQSRPKTNLRHANKPA